MCFLNFFLFLVGNNVCDVFVSMFRFMICCDTCEDWFHGKCVNITKAMGQQMEQQGKEWMCPNCTKVRQ